MQLTILGASGFLGRSLGSVAAMRDLSTRAVGRTICPDELGKVTGVRVMNYAETPAPRGEDDVLIHLAQSSHIDQHQDLQDAIRLVDQILMLGYRKACYASSAVVYGDRHEYPHGINDVSKQPGRYAALKLACEDRFVAAGGIVVRLTNLYGMGQPRSSVLGRILSQIPGSAPLLLRTLTPVRDFCWTEDAAAAVIDLCQADACGVFNVGSGTGVSIAELARLTLDVADEQERGVLAEEADGCAQSVLLVDISQTIAACGWRPKMELRAGLKQLVEGKA